MQEQGNTTCKKKCAPSSKRIKRSSKNNNSIWNKKKNQNKNQNNKALKRSTMHNRCCNSGRPERGPGSAGVGLQ